MVTFIQQWRIPLAMILFVHGAGHVLFVAPLLGLADWSQSTRSWLLGDASLAVGSVLWLASMIGFAATVIGLLRQAAWWEKIAVASSVVSLAGIALFLSFPLASPVMNATFFDVCVLAVIGLLRANRATRPVHV